MRDYEKVGRKFAYLLVVRHSMTEEYYMIKAVRLEDKSINFFLLGLSLHVNDPMLCVDFIKEHLKPTALDYRYDFFDTYEKGYFEKEGIRVEINWTIYTSYDFAIDKFSTLDQVEKVRMWVTQIFEYLMAQDGVEKKIEKVPSFFEEPIIPISKGLPSNLPSISVNKLSNGDNRVREYYIYGQRPIVMEKAGVERYFAFQWDSGEFAEDMTYLHKISFDFSGDAEKVTEEKFFEVVGQLRRDRGLKDA